MTRAIEAVIRAHQSALTGRLRGPMISALARRLAAAGVAEPVHLIAVVTALPRVVAGLREAHAGALDRLGRIEAEVHGEATRAGREQALARAIRREVSDRKRRRGDLRALRRDLDVGALQERFAGELDEAETQVELAVRLLGSAVSAALASEPTAGPQLRRAGLCELLLGQLRWRPRFTLRLAVTEALQQVCEALGPADPDGAIAAAMTGRVRDAEEHAWVQAAALKVLVAVSPGEGMGLCGELLRGPQAGAGGAVGGRRGFLLRRLVVDWLVTQLAGSRGEAARELLIASAAGGEPSEHVRVGLCLAAVAAPVADLRAMLAGLADPRREASAAVRSAALEAGVGTAIGAALLVRSLSEETSVWVLKVACAAAVRSGAGARAGLVEALTRLAARDDRPPAVHEAAAAALEAIDGEVDPRRAAWTVALAAALGRTRPGGAVKVALAQAGLPPPGDAAWLGRILAGLTREDWGVDGDVAGGQVRLRRGDRWRPRLWRLLHELGAPSPNKRQAHSHVRGRVLRGALRAHSGRLHEVTGTGVPGERVQVEREGGWGRHLPLMDDLLGLRVVRPRPVQVFSSHGVCTIGWRRGLLGRALGRARMVRRYAELAALRVESLGAGETTLRGRYVEALRGLGVEVGFAGYPRTKLSDEAGDGEAGWRPLPGQLRALFPAAGSGGGAAARGAGAEGAAAPAEAVEAAVREAGVQVSPAWLVGPDVLDWLWMHAPYFISVSANSQQALAYFLAGLIALGLIGAYWKQRRMTRDRAAIPLVIGGWGTRGKSGTERLKAGLLHGLGYRVFSKTTGCEAMFIHAPPLGPAREIYSFRPYGKATIWEQHTLLHLAAQMHSQVFLWECMALSPAYVQILQHAWMRDDLSTITNAYPDHEDIQGPAGMDVATVIAGFVPTRGALVTSEINFLPLMQAAAQRRGTTVSALGELEGERLPADLLALFPYEEHPRNIALVARMAALLGLDPTLAIVTMAAHVVPDLGVLKRFGPTRVRGRLLEFINGCSANERTGFVSNWRRTGCDALDLAREPDHYVITVVNNRDDRVSRSQVFARVMVEDVAVDRHLLIGTNTQGLLGYVREALGQFVGRQVIVSAAEVADGVDGVDGVDGARRAQERLAALLGRLRVVPAQGVVGQLAIFARGAGRRIDGAALAETALHCERWLVADAAASVELRTVRAEVRAALAGWVQKLVEAAPLGSDAGDEGDAGGGEEGGGGREKGGPPEVDAPASAAAVAEHFVRQVARTAIAGRLEARLAATMAAGPQAIAGFHATLRGAYSELFMELVEVVEDPLSSGDEVVLRCALAVPPGVRVVAMGTQNIKGTGLDFVYRWIALDSAQQALAALQSEDPALREAALQRLAHPDDAGLIDAGLVAARLRGRVPEPEEEALQARAQASAQALHASRKAALGTGARRRGKVEALLGWLEGWVDFIDGARRHGRARQVMRDLVDQRISHARAAQVMRELDARAKGGWLVKAMRAK